MKKKRTFFRESYFIQILTENFFFSELFDSDLCFYFSEEIFDSDLYFYFSEELFDSDLCFYFSEERFDSFFRRTF
jgi:hypothetical protein